MVPLDPVAFDLVVLDQVRGAELGRFDAGRDHHTAAGLLELVLARAQVLPPEEFLQAYGLAPRSSTREA